MFFHAVIQVKLRANNMDLEFPNQLFINNEFIDSSDGVTFNTVNPADESVICKVAKASRDDVEHAVDCAKASIAVTNYLSDMEV